MIVTHESMRLPGVGHEGFNVWKAVELNLSSPLFILTVRHGSESEDLSLLFVAHHELLHFLIGNPSAKPLLLDVLAPRGAARSRHCRLIQVQALEVWQPPETPDPLTVLLLANGRTVRARDLAPINSGIFPRLRRVEFLLGNEPRAPHS